MLLKCYNRQLVKDREKTRLTAAVSAAATTLTIAGVDSNAWADNDYLIIGEIGTNTAEIMQINGTVTDGTSLTIDRSGAAGGTRFAHSIDEPVYRVDYNRAEFSRNTTDSTSGVSVLATNEIQPDDEFTRYEDTANTTGYGFVRFNNQTTSAFSSYSDGVNYELSGIRSSTDPRTLWQLRKRVRHFLREISAASVLDDDVIRDYLNDKQRDVAHQRLWSFYEVERSFATVNDQFAYDLPATVQKVYTVSFDTQPLSYMNYERWKQMHWDTNQNFDPEAFTVWNGQILTWPRPAAAAATTTINQAGGISATDTSVTVAATSAFNRGDYYRLIIDSEVIYATESTSTTFTGLLRGQEGTTAASHANAATITERDIVYSAHVEPTDLIDTQDRTAIPEADVLASGAAADLALFLGEQTLHDRLLAKYEKGTKELESKYALKQTSQFGRIKDASETIANATFSRNPNFFPRGLSGTA